MPHIHHDFDFVVGAFIVHQAKVLLVHHRKLLLWLPPGGHIELHEDPDQAVHREVMEETGLEICLYGLHSFFSDPRVKRLIPPTWMDVHPISEYHRHIGLFWLARPSGAVPHVVLCAEEHFAIGWFGIDELPSPLWESTRWYCQQAISIMDDNA